MDQPNRLRCGPLRQHRAELFIDGRPLAEQRSTAILRDLVDDHEGQRLNRSAPRDATPLVAGPSATVAIKP